MPPIVLGLSQLTEDNTMKLTRVRNAILSFKSGLMPGLFLLDALTLIFSCFADDLLIESAIITGSLIATSVVSILAIGLVAFMTYRNYKKSQDAQKEIENEIEQLNLKQVKYDEINIENEKKIQAQYRHTLTYISETASKLGLENELTQKLIELGFDNIHQLLKNESQFITFIRNEKNLSSVLTIFNPAVIQSDRLSLFQACTFHSLPAKSDDKISPKKQHSLLSKIKSYLDINLSIRSRAILSGSISSFTILSSALYFGYYVFKFVGIASIAAALTSPIGIGIAVGIAALLAIGFAVCKYYEIKNEQSLNSKLETAKNVTAAKANVHEDHKKVLHQLQSANAMMTELGVRSLLKPASSVTPIRTATPLGKCAHSPLFKPAMLHTIGETQATRQRANSCPR